MGKVKLGLVGCGLMGQKVHLGNFADMEECELVAIADVRERLAGQLATRYQIPKVYRTHEDLARDPEIEAVVVTTQDDLHAPAVVELAAAGKHILVEKPLATNVEDAARAVEAARRAGVLLMVSNMKRYDPGVEMAKRLIDGYRESGELGEVSFARCHCFGGDWIANIGWPASTDEPCPPLEKTAPAWVPAERVEEFRIFNCCYCHDINLLRHLAGDARAVEYVHFDRLTKVAVLEMGGFPATVEFSFMRAGFWDEEIKIYFTDGWVEIKTPPPLLRNVPAQIEVYKGADTQEYLHPKAPWEWSFKRVAQDFVHCIKTGDKPRTAGEDVLHDMELVEEIFQKGLASEGAEKPAGASVAA